MALGESGGKVNTADFQITAGECLALAEREKNHPCLVNGANMMLKRESIQAPRCHLYNWAMVCDLAVPSTKGSHTHTHTHTAVWLPGETHTHTHTLQCGSQGKHTHTHAHTHTHMIYEHGRLNELM